MVTAEAIIERINEERNSKATIDSFLKSQELIEGNERDIHVNYDFTNGTPSNFVGFEKLQDVLLKMNWDDYHLKDINLYNVFLAASFYNLPLEATINFEQRFDIQLTIRNDTRKDPTRFVSLTIWQARDQKYNYHREHRWVYANEEQYKDAIKTELARIEQILTTKTIKKFTNELWCNWKVLNG